MPDSYERPIYDLAEFKRLVACGPLRYRIELIAAQGASKMKLDEADILACVQELDDRAVSDGGHFYKSMASETRPGLFHDVYKTNYEHRPVYCKIQIMTTRAGDKAAIIQFKRDESR